MSTRFLWVGRAAEEEASSPIPLGWIYKLTPTQQGEKDCQGGPVTQKLRFRREMEITCNLGL